MAKPDSWDNLSHETKKQIAEQLLGSLRGQLIMSQALVRAIEVMKKERYPEFSNIQDMEILLEMIFPIYAGVTEAQKEYFKTFMPPGALKPRQPGTGGGAAGE